MSTLDAPGPADVPGPADGPASPDAPAGLDALAPTSIEAVADAVREHPRLLPVGGGSKPALSTPPEGSRPLRMTGLTGIVEYDPGELVFTARAGTSVADVSAALAEHGQYLPFDPPLVDRGATLGGTVAAGLSGSGRCRHGGVRDFLLGVRFVSAGGEVVRGRGRVVKNAAGFDLPKLMVGSAGGLGVLVELSLKVVPRPEAYATLQLDVPSLTAALDGLSRLGALPVDLDALDIVVLPAGARLLVRIGGSAAAMTARLDRLRDALGGGEVVSGPDEDGAWHDARELAWVPPGWSLVKVPLTPGRIAALDAGLAGGPALRRYVARGQLAWIASPGPADRLDGPLAALGLSGLPVLGPSTRRRLGVRIGASFERRVKGALDPHGRFVEL